MMQLDQIKTTQDLATYIEGTLNDFANEGDVYATRDAIAEMILFFTNKVRGTNPDKTMDAEITELERELWMRKKVYPDQIRLGKISEKKAKIQIDRLLSAINRLKQLRQEKTGVQSQLFI